MAEIGDQLAADGEAPVETTAQSFHWMKPVEVGVHEEEPPWAGALPAFRLRPKNIVDDGESGGLREIPYITRGRDHETATLAKLLQTLPETICTIKGAPGTGKTALLANLEEYQRARGCVVRNIPVSAFETNESLANAIMGIETPQQGAGATIATEWHGSVEANIAVVKAEGAGGRTTTIRIDTGAAWYNAVMGCNALAAEAGTILTIDEAQDLDQYRTESPEWLRIQQFLQVMNSTIMAKRQRNERPRIGLVAAGLLNVRDVLNSFGMSRLVGHSNIRLGPLSERAMRQVLRDHYEARNPMGPPIPTPPERLIAQLVDEAGGNAHHITAAGLALQSVGTGIRREERANWEVADMENAIRLTHTKREQLYNERVIDNLTPGERAIADTLAHATQAWGPCLPLDDTLALINGIAAEHGENTRDVQANLIRKGVVEKRENADVFPTRRRQPDDKPHIAFPIHSMATYLNERRTLRAHAADIEAAYDRIIETHLGPATAVRRIAPWQFDDTQTVPNLKALPKRFPRPPEPTAETLKRLLMIAGDLAIEHLESSQQKPK